MSRRRTVQTLAIGLAASLAAHLALAGVLGLSFDGAPVEPQAEILPVEIVRPDVPAPPEVPANLPDSVVNGPEARPKAAPPKPRVKRAQPKPPPDTGGALAVGSTPDAGVAAETPPGPEQPTDGLAEAQLASQPIDPALVDLRRFVPPGSRVILVLRSDRMRGTPWAQPLDAILRPMPDYRTVIAGTGMQVADSFDTVVIATPDPTDVAQTFLAARTGRDPAALREEIGGPTQGSGGKARVEWTTVGEATVGKRLDPRVALNDDPRVYSFPSAGWVSLARPEHLPQLFPADGVEAQPAPGWYQRVPAIEDQTGTAGGPILLFSATDLGLATTAIPGLPPLPDPERINVTVTPHPDGLIILGSAQFADEETAKKFHDSLVDAQKSAMDSLTTRFLLGQLHARAAVERMRFGQGGKYVTFSTSIANVEGQALMKVVASWSRSWFSRPRPR